MYCYKVLVKAYPNFVTLPLVERGTYFNRQKQPLQVLCKISVLKIFCRIYRKTPVPELRQLCLTETLAQLFSCDFYKNFKYTFFYRTPPRNCFSIEGDPDLKEFSKAAIGGVL